MLRSDITSLVETTIARWRVSNPDVCVLIMGDLQEIVTDSPRDNRGTSKYGRFDNGILNATQTTHFSCVRSHHKFPQYITCMTALGDRGIGRILFPYSDEFVNWI